MSTFPSLCAPPSHKSQMETKRYFRDRLLTCGRYSFCGAISRVVSYKRLG